MRSFISLFIFLALSIATFAQQTKQITLDAIWQSSTFYPE